MNDVCKLIVLSASIIYYSYTAQGMKEGTQDIVDKGGLFLER